MPHAQPTPESLSDENVELRARLQELEDTISSIHRGDVDALIVNNDIYTLESAHAASNRLRQDVLGQMEDAVFAFDTDENVIYLNAAAERRYGVVSAEVLGRTRSDVFTETARDDGTDSVFAELAPGRRRARIVTVHHLLDGTDVHVESIVSHLKDPAGQTWGTLAVVRDVTQRWRADARREALMTLSDRLRDLDDETDIAFEAAQIIGETLQVSRAGHGSVAPDTGLLTVVRDWTHGDADSLSGTTDLRGQGAVLEHMRRNKFISIADARIDPRTADAAEAMERRAMRAIVQVPIVEQGQLVAMLYVHHADARWWSHEDLVFIRDVAERTRLVIDRCRSAVALRRSEQRLRETNENLEAAVLARTRELMTTEQALRQAQKMEAVGQLTGGIAHDFNNLLASISASLQVLRVRLGKGQSEGSERYISMSLDAVRRAGALTQRLLAFARRQTLDPKPTDVNLLISGMEDLLRRSAGPNVDVQVVSGQGLWPTRIDPSQLENSLLNLCINARDAMLPDGGHLTIETANRGLDEHAAAELELAPGDYLSLSVTDTGSGMSPDVVKRVFDPFFTTKPLGQGTGLGLSMVYGFVRQSGGQIRIQSELGRGTTMRLYLPRHAGEVEATEKAGAAESVQTGDGQTVLIIEDEMSIRSLMAEVLEEAGYRTLSAQDGQSGLRILQSGRRVDFLITDVGLPGGMNGRQVADAARVARPELKVLFVTGYAENAAVGDGQLEPGMGIITKPFEITTLAKKVREMTAQP